MSELSKINIDGTVYDVKDAVARKKLISVTGATVGQTIRISEVDENGNPTKWEAVSASSIPEHTTADNGKFLSIVDDVPTWTAVLNGEEVEF